MPDINVNKLSEILNTKADIDLNNTGVFSTSEGGGVSLTSSTPADASGKEVTSADFIKSDIQSNLLNYTTNRILEIPQDIKLELNNGTLTLKAGSKVYVPNGFEADGTTPKFDYMTLENDKVVGQSGNVTGAFAFYRSDNGTCYSAPSHGIPSGATAPSNPVITTTWYDTTNNVIKVYNGTNWISDVAFPLCIFSNSNSLVTSIDQVFNGFGYIGSTVFALPNIKVQGAFGVNEDGTYKLKTFITDHVLTFSFGADTYDRYECGFDVVENGTITYFGPYAEEIKTSEKQPSGLNFAWWNPIRGETHYVNSSGIDEGRPYCTHRLGLVNVSGGKIESMVQNPSDSIITSNALNFSQAGRSLLSGLGMPSSRYIDLTLGASGSTYTAPANGWFIISGKSTANGGYCILDTNIYEPSYMTTNDAGWFDRGFIPVRKGQVMTLRYGNYEIEADRFKFIYAKGEQ